MVKKIIVHAGFHKTGTTAIQSSFYAATEKLEKAGIIYPHTGGKAHHKAIYSFMERPGAGKIVVGLLPQMKNGANF